MFVPFALVWFCLFHLLLGVWEGLRLVIVALPELSSYLFYSNFRTSALRDYSSITTSVFDFVKMPKKYDKEFRCPNT